MRKNWLFAAVVAGSVAVAPAAQAQVFTPTFMAPRVSNDVGIYYADAGDFGLEGIFRGNFGGTNLGLRGGVIDSGGQNSDTFLTLGGELRSPIAVRSAPIDLSLIAGVQGIFGDDEAFGIQGGVSLGHTFVSPGLSITPYVAPRLAFLSVGDESDVEVLADLGFDFGFNNLSLRLGLRLGDEQADWGIGLAWRR